MLKSLKCHVEEESCSEDEEAERSVRVDAAPRKPDNKQEKQKRKNSGQTNAEDNVDH